MAKRRLTILGGRGFVGAALAAEAAARGWEVAAVGRGDWPAPGSDLGAVVYAIGLTADFRTRLADTVEAHVVELHRVLVRYRFESLLYLSSTRVYAGAGSTQEEAPLAVSPADPDQLYNVSKLAGEALCLAQASPAVRVARLANVYGAGQASPSFLASVLAEAQAARSVTIGQGPGSAKDYIAVEDAGRALLAIAERGRHRLYNVASGRNTSHGEIAGWLGAQGIAVSFRPGAPDAVFPPIEIGRLTDEFGAPKASLQSFVAHMVAPNRQDGPR